MVTIETLFQAMSASVELKLKQKDKYLFTENHKFFLHYE